MRIESKYDLFPHNTMRLHCIADKALFPKDQDELIRTVCESSANYVIIANGSNIILPKVLHKPVILLSDLPEYITIEGNVVRCSASMRIQKLIRTAQQNNLGGIEYLFSVPCTVGGAVYMNAGRGEVFHQSISDYVSSVKCFNTSTNTIETLTREECGFSHRQSVFQLGGRVILEVVLTLQRSPKEEVDKRISARIQTATSTLDASKPSAGSIFRQCDSKIMNFLKGFRIGGACWSIKTPNWISNDKGAYNWQVILLIKTAQLLHRIKHKKCTREIIIVK